MLPGTIGEPLLGLFGICAAGAVMDLLVGEGQSAQPLRAVCALATSVCVLHAVKALINL